MPTVRPPRVRSKPAVTAAVGPLHEGGFRVLEIFRGRDVKSYYLREVASEFGRGFRLDVFASQGGGEPYFVNLSGPQSTCECMGFLRWGGACKHVQALAQLVEGGAL